MSEQTRAAHLPPAAAICAWAAFTASALVRNGDTTPIGALLPASFTARDSHQPACACRPPTLTCNSAVSPGDPMCAVWTDARSAQFSAARTTLNRVNLSVNAASIREVCDAGLLAGAVTVVWQRGEVLQVNEIGYRDVDAGLPMQRDTLFRIASMTKPVTVAAVMSLVDEGKLALKDPVTRWAPELADVRVLDDPRGPLDRTHPACRAILLEDLLTHTSGLAYAFSVSGPISKAYMRLPFHQGPDAWLAALAKLPLVHQPGDRVTYSHAIDLLGVIASRVDGKPFYQVLDDRVLGPAGMTDTGFFVTEEARRRAATMYRLDEQSHLHHDVMGLPHVTPPSLLQRRRRLVVDRRRLPAVRADAARRRNRRRRAGVVAGVGPPDADRPADRRARSGTTSSERRTGWAAGSG